MIANLRSSSAHETILLLWYLLWVGLHISLQQRPQRFLARALKTRRRTVPQRFKQATNGTVLFIYQCLVDIGSFASAQGPNWYITFGTPIVALRKSGTMAYDYDADATVFVEDLVLFWYGMFHIFIATMEAYGYKVVRWSSAYVNICQMDNATDPSASWWDAKFCGVGQDVARPLASGAIAVAVKKLCHVGAGPERIGFACLPTEMRCCKCSIGSSLFLWVSFCLCTCGHLALCVCQRPSEHATCWTFGTRGARMSAITRILFLVELLVYHTVCLLRQFTHGRSHVLLASMNR